MVHAKHQGLCLVASESFCLFSLYKPLKLFDPLDGAIFGHGATIQTLFCRGPLGDATYQGPELQYLLKVKLSIDFSGCGK